MSLPRRHAALLACALIASCAAGQATPAPAPGAPATSETSHDMASHDMAAMDLMSAPVTIPDGATYTEADVRFMQGMIAHHAQAIHMSRLAANHQASPRLQKLAG